jgi:hypothetical protein
MKKAEEAKVEKCLLGFMRAHPNLNCDANVKMIRGEMDRLLLPADVPENFEIALLSVGDRLAHVATAPHKTVQAEAPVAEAQTTRVIRDSSMGIPDDTPIEKPPLPDEFSRERIVSRSFGKAEMDSLIKRFGRQNVLDRIDGKS